jgi:hypothetical protein
LVSVFIREQICRPASFLSTAHSVFARVRSQQGLIFVTIFRSPTSIRLGLQLQHARAPAWPSFCRSLLIFPLRVRFSMDLHRLAASCFPVLVSVLWIQGASFPLSVFLIDSEQRASPSVPAQRSSWSVLLSRSGVSSRVDLGSDLCLCEFCSGSISRSARTRVRSDFGFRRRCRPPTLLGLPPDFIAVSFAAALVLCSIFSLLSEQRPCRSILARPVRSPKGVFRFSAGQPLVSHAAIFGLHHQFLFSALLLPLDEVLPPNLSVRRHSCS